MGSGLNNSLIDDRVILAKYVVEKFIDTQNNIETMNLLSCERS